MKKFLVFVLLATAGYFAYDNFIKEKEVVEIKCIVQQDKRISKS